MALLDIPNDMFYEIIKRLDNPTIFIFSQVCTRFRIESIKNLRKINPNICWRDIFYENDHLLLTHTASLDSWNRLNLQIYCRSMIMTDDTYKNCNYKTFIVLCNLLVNFEENIDERMAYFILLFVKAINCKKAGIRIPLLTLKYILKTNELLDDKLYFLCLEGRSINQKLTELFINGFSYLKNWIREIRNKNILKILETYKDIDPSW